MSPEKADNVKTAGRTLDLFEVFARKRGPMSLSELGQQIGSPMSSTHALVKTLRARGYVYVLEGKKLIYPTKRMLTIAQFISQSDPVIEIATPVMERLRGETDETLILGKRQDDHIVYLEVLESSLSIRYSARPGDTKPLHSSAIGKAMLGLMDDKKLLALVQKTGQKEITPNTITDPQALLDDIRHGRDQRRFVTRGENVGDVMAISIAFTIGGEPLGIAIAGPMERLKTKEQQYTSLLAGAREEFGRLDRVSLFA